MSNWKDDLKVGDKVIIESGGFTNTNNSVSTVKRITKNLIIVSDRSGNGEVRFKKSGFENGCSIFQASMLVEYSEEKQREIDTIKMRKKIVERVENLSYDQLLKIMGIINE